MRQEVAYYLSKSLTYQQVKVEHQYLIGVLQLPEVSECKMALSFYGFCDEATKNKE